MEYVIGAFAVIAAAAALGVLSRFKRCPPDKLLIIYGNVGKEPDGTPKLFKHIHGGSIFVRPLVQDYKFIDLNPINIPLELKGAGGGDEKGIDISAAASVAVSLKPELIPNAARHLLGARVAEIAAGARDIMLDCIKLAVSPRETDSLGGNGQDAAARAGDDSLHALTQKILNIAEPELNKLGLTLINFKITSITAV